MTLVSDYENDDMNPFRVRSRREVIALLRSIGERNQLVRMVINHGADTIVTSILNIDETNDTVLLDCAPTAIMNQRVLDSKRLSFETVLENIRILFTAPSAESCVYENLPAFVIDLPTSVIRLQRREFYRVPTPLTSPVSCIVPYTREGVTTEIPTTLHNISGGGISIVDEKKLLGTAIGQTYDNCKIDLPGSGVITVTLQVRNVLELTLTNGKSINRLGCEFIRPSNGTLAVVQKYITKIEREQNAKATGLG
ncbi:MAG: flagellar brake protein [Burkholderiaceae bacterium]|uniref:Flagellar brake protein YcgR n=1 Tax=Herminiimonas contaminans TaxID=1111140 RepID=A0ABS0ER11_9BURK|nr:MULTISPECIES: flagellar brake protein [Oxalobacteraceae]MBF8177155.1 flagellar brake protein [Herminiimonas contaminans]MBX9797911.1 flagellar brake protein [Burkholderiaceae bacterium]